MTPGVWWLVWKPVSSYPIPVSSRITILHSWFPIIAYYKILSSPHSRNPSLLTVIARSPEPERRATKQSNSLMLDCHVACGLLAMTTEGRGRCEGLPTAVTAHWTSLTTVIPDPQDRESRVNCHTEKALDSRLRGNDRGEDIPPVSSYPQPPTPRYCEGPRSPLAMTGAQSTKNNRKICDCFLDTVNYEMPSQDFFLILSENSIEFFPVAKGYGKKL